MTTQRTTIGCLTGAACVSAPGLPWTTDTDEVPDVVVDQMRDVCMACPVRAWCDAQATYLDVTGGFWAGRDRDPELPERIAARAVEWLPVKDRSGFVIGEQAALTLGGVA